MHRSDVIGIDASRLNARHLTGTETYTYQLLNALAGLNHSDHIELYFNASQPPSGAPDVGVPVCLPFPRFWTHARLSAAMVSRRPGVLFVPAHVIPLLHPRSVVTIHDLGYLHHPEAHSPRAVRMLDWTTRWSVQTARRIIAISETTKQDLIARYRVPPNRITTIHHGVSESFRPSDADEIARVRSTYTLPEQFALAVGTIQPRKNYARLAAAAKRAGVPLVIAGTRGWMADEVEREMHNAGTDAEVLWLGYVPDHDLVPLYSAATVSCQVALYEGFGMPVIEAMACGVPVLAADRSALPEVAGDAALFVDPLDVESIANGLARVLSDDDLRDDLRAKGMARATSFRWERCASETLNLLRSVRDA